MSTYTDTYLTRAAAHHAIFHEGCGQAASAAEGAAISAAGAAKSGAISAAGAMKRGAISAAREVKQIAVQVKDSAVEVASTVKDAAVTVAGLAAEAAIGIKDGAVEIAKAAKRDYYIPLTDKAIEILSNGEKDPNGGPYLDGQLIGFEDTFTRRFSAILSVDEQTTLKGKVQAGRDYTKAAKGRTKTVIAALRVYDNLVATYGDKFSRKVAGRGGYYLAKLGLEVATLSLISRSRIGRVVQEALATAVGGLARLIAKVAEYALRLLPYIAAAAVAAATIGGIVALGIFVCPWAAAAGTLALAVGILGLAYIFLNQDMNKLAQEVEQLKQKPETAPTEARTEPETASTGVQTETATAPQTDPTELDEAIAEAKTAVSEADFDEELAKALAEVEPLAPTTTPASATLAPKPGLLGWGWTAGGFGI